jgi:nitroreductase
MAEIHELIEKRWSPRAFDEKPVEPEKLTRIFEAARRAPSSNNEQPWRYLLGIKGKGQTWEKLFDSLNDWNKKWAVHAPVIAISIAKNSYTKSGAPNKHQFYDAGQSAAYLTMQATAEGLFVHQMAGFFPDKVVASFNIPEGFYPITAIVIGYIGKPEILPEEYRKNEDKKVIRRNLEEIVFEAWDEPASLK